jgi:predicted nucleic acid-binding protein
MNLYLDTSALVKLYVAEAGSSEVRRLVAEAGVVCTSVVGLPEARAALARRAREGSLGPAGHERALRALAADQERLFLLEVTLELAVAAGDLAERRALRGLDALHLASALLIQERIGEPLTFLCFDDRLRSAAREEGLRVEG